MSDCIFSIFRLGNKRGLRAPFLNVEYRERDSNNVWQMVCAETRAYVLKVSDKVEGEMEDQAADSHFMVRRITSSLLLGGSGLFEAEAVGRLMLKGIGRDFNWEGQFDRREIEKVEESPTVRDWFEALCKYTVLRRAADDAHLALSCPHEAYVFVYRGLEWLKEGLRIGWEDIATDIGVPLKDLRDFKKSANYETGVRHASKSGVKLRTNAEGYALAVCSLFDAIWGARKRLEPKFEGATPEERSQAVMRALISFRAYD